MAPMMDEEAEKESVLQKAASAEICPAYDDMIPADGALCPRLSPSLQVPLQPTLPFLHPSQDLGLELLDDINTDTTDTTCFDSSMCCDLWKDELYGDNPLLRPSVSPALWECAEAGEQDALNPLNIESPLTLLPPPTLTEQTHKNFPLSPLQKAEGKPTSNMCPFTCPNVSHPSVSVNFVSASVTCQSLPLICSSAPISVMSAPIACASVSLMSRAASVSSQPTGPSITKVGTATTNCSMGLPLRCVTPMLHELLTGGSPTLLQSTPPLCPVPFTNHIKFEKDSKKTTFFCQPMGSRFQSVKKPCTASSKARLATPSMNEGPLLAVPKTEAGILKKEDSNDANKVNINSTSGISKEESVCGSYSSQNSVTVKLECTADSSQTVPASPYSLEHSIANQQKLRFQHTKQALEESGMIDVTLKCANLVKDNRVLDQDIADLRKSSQELLGAILRNTQNAQLREFLLRKKQEREAESPELF